MIHTQTQIDNLIELAIIQRVELKKLVVALPGFREEPGHGVNEKILEHIQAAWIDERSGKPPVSDDD